MVSHLEGELEMNGLEAPDELQINTMTQQATKQNPEKPEPTCHHFRKISHYQNQCHQLKREKDQAQINTIRAGNNSNKNGGQTNSNSNKKISNKTNRNNTNSQSDRKPSPVCLPCKTCAKTNHVTEKCYFGANAAKRPSPWRRRPEGQTQFQQRNAQKQIRHECWSCSPNFKLKTSPLHSGAAYDRPETTKAPKVPPIPEVVWQ